MNETAQLVWDECMLVERIPGKMNGQPVIKGTRIRPETIVENFEGGSGLDEIHENYPHLPLSTIRKILEFHRSHQLTP
jgi:uncharacterized protein (DUF433 family)